jgi:hypothetical protein
VVRDTLIDDGLSADVSSSRWNASAGRWQDADQPLEEGGAGPDYAKEAAEEKVPHPLFVYIEGHEPHFLRDLGV